MFASHYVGEADAIEVSHTLDVNIITTRHLIGDRLVFFYLKLELFFF